jgi:hypothetical protein
MPAANLPDDLYQQAVDAWRETGKSVRLGAELLGLNCNTFASRLKMAKARGMHLSPVDPAIAESMAAVGTKLVSVLAWAKTKTEEGTSFSVLLKPEQPGAESLLDEIRAAFEGMEPAPPVAPPSHHDADLLTVYPLADVHFGLMAWGRETGEAWDTNAASDRVREWIGRAVDASPASALAVILDCGDLTHADDQKNQTPTSKHGGAATGRNGAGRLCSKSRLHGAGAVAGHYTTPRPGRNHACEGSIVTTFHADATGLHVYVAGSLVAIIPARQYAALMYDVVKAMREADRA